VERRARDGHAADVDRLQERLWCQGTGATDIHDNFFEAGTGGEWLELVRNRPSRRLRHRSEGALLLPRVHLHDDPVDLVLERASLARPVRALLDDRFYVFVHLVRADA
jgi:hypothetical protein